MSDAQGGSTAAVKRAQRYAPSDYRVLVVDDEQQVLDLMTDILKEAGLTVEASASPIAALQKVRRGKFDALVLDVYMPELPGMLFHAKLKLIDPELARRTVFVSGQFKSGDLQRHLQDAAVLLPKPFEAADLVGTVAKLIGGAPRWAAG